MRDLMLDPIGMGLLRELVEAWEAMRVITDIFYDDPRLYKETSAFDEKPLIEERLARDEIYDNLAGEFCGHLLIMGSPHVDISDLKTLWTSSMRQVEEDRAHGRLWDATWDVSRAYINLYRAN